MNFDCENVIAGTFADGTTNSLNKSPLKLQVTSPFWSSFIANPLVKVKSNEPQV